MNRIVPVVTAQYVRNSTRNTGNKRMYLDIAAIEQKEDRLGQSAMRSSQKDNRKRDELSWYLLNISLRMKAAQRGNDSAMVAQLTDALEHLKTMYYDAANNRWTF